MFLAIWSALSVVPEAPDDASVEGAADVDAADEAPVLAPVDAADVLLALVCVPEAATVPELVQAAVVRMAPPSATMAVLLTPNLMPIPQFDEKHRAQLV
jgi:hypothetical protein